MLEVNEQLQQRVILVVLWMCKGAIYFLFAVSIRGTIYHVGGGIPTRSTSHGRHQGGHFAPHHVDAIAWKRHGVRVSSVAVSLRLQLVGFQFQG